MGIPSGRPRGLPAQRALPTWTALLVIALTLLFVAFPEPRTRTQILASQLLLPVQRALSQMVESGASLIRTVAQAGELAAQNRAYQEEIDRFQAVAAQMREIEAENRDLRALLGLRERLPVGSLVPAQVIGRDPLALVQAVVLDRGGADGVAVNLPVITYRGVAGRIVEAQPASAKALLITDVNSAVSVRTQGPGTSATGLARGTGQGRLLLQYVPRDDTLAVGDVVTTSGVGGIFPPGLVVGRVLQTRQTDVGVFQEALVEPAVSLRDLERVYVLLKRVAPEAS